MQRHRSPVFFWMILALGFVLRLFRLGASGFWVDELGVAQAAMAPSLREAMAVASSHVMAMPMDYVVTWAMGQFAVREGWLRLPAAVWGTLTLPAAYLLYRQLTNRHAAAWGMLLLALSSALIMYSQELRFYAPLVFFYTLSTALGLRAVRTGRARDWSAFVAITTTGIFFHVYVIFAFANVVLFSMSARRHRKNQLPFLLLSFFVLLIAAVIAVLKFGSLAGEHSSLFDFETPWQVVLGGLGFMPLFPATWTAYLFGIVLLLLTLLGLLRAGKNLFVGISLFLQIGLILVLDARYHYFASARQLLMLLPLTGVFTAHGLRTLLIWVKHTSRKAGKPLSLFNLRTAILVFVLIIASFEIVPYYRTDKTSTRAILRTLEQTWEPGERVFVSPAYSLPVFLYYAPWLSGELRPFDQAALTNATFIISDPDSDFGDRFELLYEASTSPIYPQSLWIKK